MILPTVQIVCDSCHAVKLGHYPNALDARATARKHAWKCEANGSDVVDLCPRCYAPPAPAVAA